MAAWQNEVMRLGCSNQPISSPDIMGMDRANQMAAISIGAMMLDFLADKLDRPGHAAASHLLDQAITTAFARNRVRPMGLAAMWTQNLLQRHCRDLSGPAARVIADNHLCSDHNWR